MKKIINYIRRCLCKHEWEVEQKEITFRFDDPICYKWSRYTCKKCGYFKVERMKDNKNEYNNLF